MLNTVLYIFTKAPIPGQTKSRLIPALGAERAARLQQRMTQEKVIEAVASRLGEVTLYCTPDCDHPTFQQLRQQYGVSLRQQQGEGLGERMSSAMAEGLAAHQKVILTGTDSPQLGQEAMIEAEAALDQHDVVFVPALDGGYVLIAMRCLVAEVFQGVSWGSQSVMRESRGILQREGVSWAELAPLRDVDEAEDLLVVPHRWLFPD